MLHQQSILRRKLSRRLGRKCMYACAHCYCCGLDLSYSFLPARN